MASVLPRITARVDFDTQDLLAQAAKLSGVSSINSFVLSAAIEKAKLIIQREQSLQLTQKDTLMLMDALDRPAKENEKLIQAASRYASKHK